MASSRLRERRQARQRADMRREPAILRDPRVTAEVERPAVQHGVRGSFFVSWRLFSLLIVVSLLIVTAVFVMSDAFYVHSIAVGGLNYMTVEEIFALTGVADLHIFWVDPVQVRAELLRSPTIADATVTLGWPPRMVQIVIQERAPALVWEQSGVAVWIDLQGRVMRQRQDRPDLIRISADNLLDGPPGVSIDPAIVLGALQLRDLLPDQPVLRYHPDKGLGFNDSRGWEVWLGVGTDMRDKILIYNAMVGDIQARGIVVNEINVSDAAQPFYSVLSGR